MAMEKDMRTMSGDAEPRIILLDSITKITADHTMHVVIAGSHGGTYSGFLASQGGLRGAIFNDAGIGLDAAGIGALSPLGEIGLAAATVDYRSARIGDGADICRRGIISHVNAPAYAAGCRVGQSARICAEKMTAAPVAAARMAVPLESRKCLHAGAPAILGVDSNSLLTDKDTGAIIVSGSHGGLLGGHPASAIGPDVIAASFNDAGIGIDNAGVSRLPALDRRHIAAVAVSASTARIGDAQSSWMTGVISAQNATAARHGATTGMKLKDFLTDLLARILA
jgi:hypothetical protein